MNLKFQECKLLVLFLCVTSMFTSTLCAQEKLAPIRIVVTADHDDWNYHLNEQVIFKVKVLKNDLPLNNVMIKYLVGPEKMEQSKLDSLKTSGEEIKIKGGTMKVPGFLRCTVTAEIEGKTYTGLATAAYEVEQIKPSVLLPNDFWEFWNKAKSEAAQIPMDPKLTPLPELSTEKVKVYMVSIQNYRLSSRIYGILCVPNKKGKFPAVLQVPGAGIHGFKGDTALAERGIITLQIGIHGIPVNLGGANSSGVFGSIYNNLYNGALSNYPVFNLDNRDTYYYKRVYMGCIRAIDYLVSLPEYDGQNLAVSGGSQGGALSIVTAALDSRVKFLRAFYPALSDLTGYLHGRAGGWPHLLNAKNAAYHNKPDKIATIPYYDVVNFARFVKVPGFYSWGFNDLVCPPTSIYAAYNVINAPKELMVVKETGHISTPVQIKNYQDWLVKNLTK